MNNNLKSINLGLIGLIVAIVVIRLLLIAIGVDQNMAVVSFWLNFSDYFIYIFKSSFPTLRLFGSIDLEMSSVLAIFSFISLGYTINNLIDIPFAPNFAEGVRRILNFVFRFSEIVLFYRLILKLFVAGDSTFVKTLYSSTDFLNANILPQVRFGSVALLELSIVLVLILVILCDIVLDMIFDRFAETNKQAEVAQQVRAQKPTVNIQHNYPTTVVHYPGPPLSSGQARG